MDEEQQIKSLGASVVESETFEKKYMQSLENQLEQLKKETGEETAETGVELEDGELEDTSDEPQVEEDDQEVAIVDQVKLEVDDSETPKGPVILGVPPNETPEEKRVRTGEMTPFGTVIERNRTDPRATFLDFTAYLKSQRAYEKRIPAKVPKQVEESRSSSKTKQQKRKALDTSVGHNSKKKAPRLESKGYKRSTLDGSASEEESPVLEEDIDYVPPESDDDWKPDVDEDSNGPSSRKAAVRAKKAQKYKEVDTDESFSEEEEIQKGRSKKNPDDGDLKTYQARLDSWKSKEKRFTGHFHELDGGFKMPEHIWNSLYDYQKVGVNWVWELHQKNCGGILGDEMGLGKTIQIIAFLAGLSSSNMLFRFTSFRGLGPTLLVCPATVMHQWVKEFHQWWPPFRVVILHETGSFTGSKEALIRSTASSNGILVTSYAGVVNNLNEILKHTWHYVILDEGHKIRNPDAQITLAVKQIPTSHRLILSGSPLQNNLKELWSLFDFVFPGKLGTLPVFMEQFSVPITQGGYSNASEIQVAAAYKCAKTLRDIIKPYLLRRMKSDVKDHLKLPEKTEQVLFCKLSEEQRACYISYINSKEVESIVGGRMNMFSGLINLRKICNHPHLFDGGPKKLINPLKKKSKPKDKKQKKFSDDPYKSLNPYVSDAESSESEYEMDDPDEHYGYWMKSGKMVVLETLLKLWAKQKHKVLLFTQSRQMLFILENFVRQQNYTYLKMDGTVSVGSRQPMIKQFNEDPDLFVFLLTTRVGGLGVNLTGANRVVIFDPDWNPSTDSQARERAWRIGQERQVTVYRLITSGTIEEKIYHRQIFKQFLTNRVLKDPKQKRFFKNNDVMELFSFNESAEKGADSEALFVGTGSFLNKKAAKRRLKKSKSDSKDSMPTERTSGKFKGVPNLVKQKTSKKEDLGVPQENEKQDDYVLRKLFRKSNVSAALQHDSLLDSTEQDYVLVEKEAERVAQDAVKVLKQSRSQCWTAESGRVTWTGSHGSVRDNVSNSAASASSASPQKKLRFKRPEKPAAATSDSAPTEKSFFSTADNPSDAPMSTSELIAAIRARKREIMAEEAGDNNQENDGSSSRPVDVDLVKNEYVELLRDIREFIAFQAQSDGQATTDEILQKFADKLPAKDSPIFKQMLSQLCTFRRVDGKGLWKLKPEFS